MDLSVLIYNGHVLCCANSSYNLEDHLFSMTSSETDIRTPAQSIKQETRSLDIELTETIETVSVSLRRKSVENLVISSQDAIGQSISHALSFSGAITQQVTQHINQEYRNVSRSPSPCRRSTEPPILEYEDCNSLEALDATNVDQQTLNALITNRPPSGSGDAQRVQQAPRPAESSRAKKKSWYSSLYPTYKSRAEDFKKTFKDVPDDERLIVDYSCALQKDILVHGRLYVSQNYLCFYANIFRWETTLILRWKDVTAITKEKTALVIPNAIHVCTDSEKYFFASLSSRDKAYLMLFRVWQNALMDQPLSSPEVWQWVHSCYGEELGFNSDDEDYIRDNDEDKISNMRLSVDSAEDFLDTSMECAQLEESGIAVETSLNSSGSGQTSTSVPINMIPNPTRHVSNNIISSSLHESSPTSNTTGWGRSISHSGIVKTDAVTNGFNGVDSLPTDMSDTSESDEEKVVSVLSVANSAPASIPTPAAITSCTNSHEGRVLIDADIGLHIDQLFTMIFTNSNFYVDFNNMRKTTDVQQGPWKHDPEKGIKCRVITYTMALNSTVGPKTAQVTETQEILNCSRPGHLYSIDLDTINGGVPYADSFSVKVHFCMTKKTDQLTHLQVTSHINYKKSVWGLVKNFIEKNCWAGLEDYFNCLLKCLYNEAEDEHIPSKRKSRRRRRHMSVEEGPNIATSGLGVTNSAVSSSVTNSVRPSISRGTVQTSDRSASRTGIYILCVTLIALLLLNGVLYWRLWALDNGKASMSWTKPPSITAPSPEQIAEWSQTLKQQSSFHLDELDKWRSALNEAISLLKQTEKALGNLQSAIKPTLDKTHSTTKSEL